MSLFDTMFTRAAAISGLETTVRRAQQFHVGELPGIAVYPGETSVEDVAQGGAGYILVENINIEYHKEATDNPESDSRSMIAEIRAAVELPVDPYLKDENGINQVCSPVQLSSIGAPDLPEDAGGIVAVLVTYELQYTSQYGG